MLLTRTGDQEISLSARAEFANQNNADADYFVSIHTNAGGGTGFESFVYPGSKGKLADQFRNKLHDQMMKYFKQYGIVDRGKKYENFAVLRETDMPAVLLENLFIDSADAQYLKDEVFLAGLANEIAYGLVVALGLKLKEKEQEQADTSDDVLKEMARLQEEVKLLQQEANRLNQENIELRQSLRRVAGIAAPYMAN